MKIFRFFSTFTILAVLILSCTPKDRYMTVTGYAQGGTYTVKLNLNGNEGTVKVKPEEIRDSIDTILKKIDNSLSGYNKNSLLSRFNEGESITPDSLFTDIFSHAVRIYNETDGVVDVAAGPLFDLWGFGFKSGDFPSDAKVREVMQACGMKRMLQKTRAS